MDFNDTCRRTRGNYLRGASFVISNHFANTPPLGLPDIAIAEQANLAENIRNRTDACTAMLNRTTNLLAVDFWSVGDTLAVVQEYNSLLPDITQAPSMSPSPSASPTSGTSNIESSATQQPVTLLTKQPTALPTALPSSQPSAETAMPSDADSTFAPGSESFFVPSAAVQVNSTAAPTMIIVSTPEPSFYELSATNAQTSSPSYGNNSYGENQNVSLNDFT